MKREVEIARDLARKSVDDASLCRTRRLMAHNHMHAIVHGKKLSGAELEREWNKYLAELDDAEAVAATPA